MDGDGLDDIVVGEPGFEPLYGPSQAGAVRVYRGYDGAQLFSKTGELPLAVDMPR